MGDDSLPISPYQKYIQESKSPLCCLIFILPFLCCYHIGIWLSDHLLNERWLNGADRILGNILYQLGGAGSFIGVFCIITTLLVWQHASDQAWRISLTTIVVMSIESSILAFPLFLVGKAIKFVLLAINATGISLPTNIFLAMGAGIYEEFVFRMLLMSVLLFIFGTIMQFEGFRLSLLVICVQGILFAFFHYLPGSQEKIILASKDFWSSFLFRFVAGIYFAIIYKERGLGIAVGAHAFYDIIAITMNTLR